MIRPMHFPDVNSAWRMLAHHIMEHGSPQSPRGLPTKEVSHATLSFDMSNPVLACKVRKLSYQFMAAEPLWYLSGSDKLAEIVGANPRMAEFSDNGHTLYGAYGPPIMAQMDHVVGALLKDRDTRQAWLTIWKQNPEKSKDIPCTIALGWRISLGRLHCHAIMRSSDAYLGVPYDWFSFSIISAYVASCHNAATENNVRLGNLYWTAASSHIYTRDMDHVRECLNSDTWAMSPQVRTGGIGAGDFREISDGLFQRSLNNRPLAKDYDLKPVWRTNGS